MSLKAFEGTNVLFDSIKNENDQHYWKKKGKTKTLLHRDGEREITFPLSDDEHTHFSLPL